MSRKYGKGIVIVGTQFGDEGKGKIADFFASKPHIEAVVRFNGGANAGHTIIVTKRKYTLHLVPSGLIYGKRSLIGNGCAVDLEKLKEELVQFPNNHNLLQISERAQLVLPHHKKLDTFQEEIKRKEARNAGTTKRGIGPTYHDKASRFGIRFGDLWDEFQLKRQINLLSTYYQNFPSEISAALERTVLNNLFTEWRSLFGDKRCDSGVVLSKILQEGKNVLFEGAQSTLLDIDHGIYPFNTSSNCVVAAAAIGTGVSSHHLTERIGVVKAYTSRVGSGPIIAEISDSNTGRILQEQGKEFGTSTGRPRRIAWFDLVSLKYVKRLNGLTGLALTKLDILGHLPEFEIVTDYEGYDMDPDFPSFPMNITDIEKIRPVTEIMPSWSVITSEEWLNIMATGWNAFPSELKKLVGLIESYVNVPVVLLGIGPERSETFERIELESLISKFSP